MRIIAVFTEKEKNYILEKMKDSIHYELKNAVKNNTLSSLSYLYYLRKFIKSISSSDSKLYDSIITKIDRCIVDIKEKRNNVRFISKKR